MNGKGATTVELSVDFFEEKRMKPLFFSSSYPFSREETPFYRDGFYHIYRFDTFRKRLDRDSLFRFFFGFFLTTALTGLEGLKLFLGLGTFTYITFQGIHLKIHFNSL